MLNAFVGLALTSLLIRSVNAWLPSRAAPRFDKQRAKSALLVRTASSTAPSKEVWVPGASVRLKDSGLLGSLVQQKGGWWSVQLAGDAKQIASRASNLAPAALVAPPDDGSSQQVCDSCICVKPNSWPALISCADSTLHLLVCTGAGSFERSNSGTCRPASCNRGAA